MRRKLCSISVDLDPLHCYASIHGLGVGRTPAADEAADPIYAHALPRLLDLFDEIGARGTFFVIGEDAGHPVHRERLREAVARGHELANHTLHHPYDLPSLSQADADEEIRGGHSAIEAATGVECVGFRAPGYNIDDRALGVLGDLGYRYDSSMFPCPPYYLAKGAVMTAIRLRGQRSGSSMVQARTQMAPLTPYRPKRGAGHRRGDRSDGLGLVELPMCVIPVTRIPVIGTSLVMAGAAGARAMVAAAALHHRHHLNLELHGIDVLDPERDGNEAGDAAVDGELRRRQPDLKRSVEAKLSALRAAFRAAYERGYDFVPCAEAASEIGYFV